MTYWPTTSIKGADSPSIDAFSRLRVSNPESVFDAQFTYDLQPLLFEQITAESGASIAHNTTERSALMTFSTTPADGEAYMQTYEWFRYQPGKSQQAFITFNMVAAAANVQKFAGYSDGNNGIEFLLDGSTPYVRILSDTTAGDDAVAQGSWNLDTLDGNGPSGLDLDITKTQIFVIDFQALYVGRVRVGFDINGLVVYCHEFNHANLIAYPYIQTANLPLRCGMTCSAEASTTMHFYCSSVISEGGQEDTVGYGFSISGAATAGNGARAHALSVRPNTTFNSLANRAQFRLDSVDVIVTGANPVIWELVLGQAITGTTAFTDVNATYSAMEYNTAGTISGSPAIVIATGFVPATNQAKASVNRQITNRYPITLDAAGAVRALGTLTLIATGVGGTSAMYVAFNWREIR